jgi:hypothetical protein
MEAELNSYFKHIYIYIENAMNLWNTMIKQSVLEVQISSVIIF